MHSVILKKTHSTKRPRSRSRPWRRQSGQDHVVIITDLTSNLLKTMNRKNKNTSTVEKMKQAVIDICRDCRERKTPCFETLATLLLSLRNRMNDTIALKKRKWRERQKQYRSLQQSLLINNHARQIFRDTMLREKSTWNVWSSRVRESFLKLENASERLIFAIQFGDECVSALPNEFHDLGSRFYEYLLNSQFSTYLSYAHQKVMRKAHSTYHSIVRHDVNRARHQACSRVRKVWNDAVRRVRRRCETWDVPIDLRNAALAQYRESSNLILAHFEKLHDLSRVLDVHCGRSHSLVLTHAGEVWSLGMFFASVGVRNMKRFYQSHTH